MKTSGFSLQCRRHFVSNKDKTSPNCLLTVKSCLVVYVSAGFSMNTTCKDSTQNIYYSVFSTKQRRPLSSARAAIIAGQLASMVSSPHQQEPTTKKPPCGNYHHFVSPTLTGKPHLLVTQTCLVFSSTQFNSVGGAGGSTRQAPGPI